MNIIFVCSIIMVVQTFICGLCKDEEKKMCVWIYEGLLAVDSGDNDLLHSVKHTASKNMCIVFLCRSKSLIFDTNCCNRVLTV